MRKLVQSQPKFDASCLIPWKPTCQFDSLKSYFCTLDSEFFCEIKKTHHRMRVLFATLLSGQPQLIAANGEYRPRKLPEFIQLQLHEWGRLLPYRCVSSTYPLSYSLNNEQHLVLTLFLGVIFPWFSTLPFLIKNVNRILPSTPSLLSGLRRKMLLISKYALPKRESAHLNR